MNITHLKTCDGSIRCVGCGYEFEVSAQTLGDPVRLIALKESIAGTHTCRVLSERQPVRVFRAPSGAELSRYWDREVQRLTAQCEA